MKFSSWSNLALISLYYQNFTKNATLRQKSSQKHFPDNSAIPALIKIKTKTGAKRRNAQGGTKRLAHAHLTKWRRIALLPLVIPAPRSVLN